MTALAANVMQFARLLRRAGMPMGPGKVATALEALQLIDIGHRADMFNALHAVFVERHAQSALFRLAFDRFWRANAGVAQPLEATKSDLYEAANPAPRRITEAFGTRREVPKEMIDDVPDVVIGAYYGNRVCIFSGRG